MFHVNMFSPIPPIIAYLAISTWQAVETAESKPNLNTLRVAQVLFRHGSRSIDITYPTDPYIDESYWAPGYSQLNNEGKLQAFELGVFLRERYDGFIKSTYDLKDLYVLSSDFPRTIQTAYSALAGFYLPNDPKMEENQTIRDAISRNEVEISLPWKSVPVHTIPQEHDNIIRQKEEICPKYFKMYKENIDAYPGKEERDRVFQIFNENGGVKIEHLATYSRLYDALVVEAQRNMTLPSWTNEIYKTEEGMKVFRSLFPYMVSTPEMTRLRVGPLLQRFVENMKKNETKFENRFLESTTGQKKMYFFSGHDATVFTALYTLGINNGLRAEYCAALILELHEDENGRFVEIYYRNDTSRDPYQLIIPQCGNPCSLQRFEEIVDPYIPEDWQKECQIYQDPNIISSGWIVVIILLVWVVFFFVLQCWLQSSTKCCKERKRRSSYAQLM